MATKTETILADVAFKVPVKDMPEWEPGVYVYCDVIEDTFIVYIKGKVYTTPVSNVLQIRIKDKSR